MNINKLVAVLVVLTTFVTLVFADKGNETIAPDVATIAKQVPVKPGYMEQLYNLMTFANLVLCLCVIATFLFILAFTWKIILWIVIFSAYFSLVPLTVLYNTIIVHFVRWETVYIVGISLAGLFCIPNPVTMWDSKIGYLYLFEHQTPFLGVLFYLSVVTHWAWMQNLSKKMKNAGIIFGLYFPVLAWTAWYHTHSFLGTLTVWSLYGMFGFCMGPIPGGYFAGFFEHSALIRSYLLSVVLIVGFLYSKLTGNLYEHLYVFETGALFWGPFVGLLAMLTMSDRFYMKTRKYYVPEIYVFMQLGMLGSCIVIMYYGTLLNITQMMSIGGTFMVLWMLDLEYVITSSIGSGSFVGATFITATTLYGLYYYITHFPGYFIFN